MSISAEKVSLDREVNEKDHSVYLITEEDFYKQYNNSQFLGIELKNKPRTLEVDDNNNVVYVISDQDVSIINGTANAKLDTVIPLPLSPLELEVNENTNTVYILFKYGLYSLDEKTNNLTTIGLSEPLSNIEVNADSGIVYLTSDDSASLFAIH